MSEYEAKQALQDLLSQYEPRQVVRYGQLGDSNGTVMVANRPGWAYIRYRDDLNRLAIVRYLLPEQLPDDMPVRVGKKYPDDPYEQVLGVDWKMYAYSPTQSTVTQWATPAITLEDLAPGKVAPTDPTSLSVNVRAFLYDSEGEAVEYGGGPIDLTASVPGVAGHRLTLVYMDLDTDLITAEDGAIVAVGVDAVAPSVPENGIPLAVVDIANGDTAIVGDDIYQYKILYDVVGTSLASLGDYARGYIIRGGATDWEAHDASGDGYVLVGDGTDIYSEQDPSLSGNWTWNVGPQTIHTGNAANVGFVVVGAAAQAADLVQIHDSGANVLAGYDERGIPFADGNTNANNYFAGADAGNVAATGQGDTIIGYQAGDALTTGSYNTAVGRLALSACQTGAGNVAIGNNALGSSTAGSLTAVGAYALEQNVAGTGNVGLGNSALRYNVSGTNNIAIGRIAMQGVVASSNTNYNVGIGTAALYDVRTGGDANVAIGYWAGTALTTGSNNVLLGDEAGSVLTIQDGNVFIGYEVGKTQLAGSDQLAIGNTDTATPLIYGSFSAPSLRLGASVTIGWGTAGVDYSLTFDGETNDGLLTWMEDEDYFAWSDDIAFTTTARIAWTKYTADNLTLNNGSSADAVADLQTMGDGNFYHVDEAAATPGIDLEVEFVSVTAFNWVQIKAVYDGGATHAVGIQLYNFNTTTWDTFNAAQTGQEDVTNAGEYILNSYDFFVPDDTNYVGTGGDAGDVRVRFHHTMLGNASHDLYIDVVALYQ